MSLRARAMLILGSIEILTTLAIILSASIYLHRAGLAQAQQHAEDALRLIRAAVAESLFVVNENSAAEVIGNAFYEIPSISYLQIVGEGGQVIAEKRKGLDLTGDSLHLIDSIELGGIQLGTLHLHFSTQAITAIVRRQTLIMVGFAAVGLVISSLLMWAVMGRLGDVLASMESGLQDLVRKNQADSLPIPPGQELGRLVQAYNNLIERLHGRNLG